MDIKRDSMKRFRYSGIIDNKVEKGYIEEQSVEDAKNLLKSRGINIIDIVEQKSIKDLISTKKVLKPQELANISGQFGMILNSGISLIKGIEVIIAETKDLRQKRILQDILEYVKKGISLAKAMEMTEAFPKIMTDMILSGELTGDIDTVLFNLEVFYQREATIKSKLKSASIYPLVILSTTIAMLVFFDLFIFQRLKNLFMLNPDLPLVTKILMAFLEYINNNFLYSFLIFSAIIIAILYIRTIPKIKYYIDILTFKIPLIKELKKEVITSRFVSSMYIFIKSGLPMVKIVDSFDMILANEYYIQKLKKVKEDIITGGKISDAISKLNLFDPLVIQMINVGEETGRLEDSLDRLNKVYDKRIETTLSKLMSLVEPAFTLIIGIFVLIIVIAVAMPILDISKGIR